MLFFRVWKFNQDSNELFLLENNLWYPKGISLNDNEETIYVSVSLENQIIEIPTDSQTKGYSILAENLSFYPAGLYFTSNSTCVIY